MANVSTLLLAGDNPLSFRPQWAPQPLSIDLSSVCLHRHTRVGIRMNGYGFAAGVSSTSCNAHSFPTKLRLLQKQSQNLPSETNSGVSPKLASKTPTRELHLTKVKIAIKLSFLDWAQMLLITAALLFVPFILAFLTYFYTPTVGLSGRSVALLGVYTNCLCTLPVNYWTICYTDDPNAYVPLGSNSADDESAAQKWWTRGARRGCFYAGLHISVGDIRRD